MRRASSSSTLLQTGSAQSVGNGVNDTVELSLYVGEFAFFGVTEGIKFAALKIDFFVEASDEFFNEFWCHQALAEAVDDQPFQSRTTDALPVGTGTAAPGGRAGNIIAPDRGVTASTLLAVQQSAQQAA